MYSFSKGRRLERKYNNTFWRRLIYFMVSTLVIGFALDAQPVLEEALLEEQEIDEGEEGENPLVEVEAVVKKDLERVASISGQIEPGEQVVVLPQVEGEVQEVAVEEGSRVEEGEMLIALDDTDYRLQLQEARTALKGAEAQLAEAEAGLREGELVEAETALQVAQDSRKQLEEEYSRVKKLYQEDFATRQELEQVDLQLKQAKSQEEAAGAALETAEEGARDEQIAALSAQVEGAGTSVELAQRMVDRTRITAPLEGKVALLDAKEGQLVAPGEAVAIIINTDFKQAVAPLPEIYVNKVQVGDEIELKAPAAGDKVYPGIIQHIGDLPPEDGRSYPLEVKIQEADEYLLAGMFCRIDLVLEREKNIPVVPRHSIVEWEGEEGVFILKDDDTVSFQPVTAGLSQEGQIGIKKGVEEGMEIVVEGMHQLSPGQEVVLLEAGDYLEAP